LIGTAVNAQDVKVKKKEVIKTGDNTYSVIEYPVDKEVSVNLLPATTISGAKGVAIIKRSGSATKVHFDLTGIPADTSSYYAYAVDPTGTPTLLGPLTIQGGIAKADFDTPLNQFMIVVSPNQGLTTLDQTAFVFRSDIPAGYTAIPIAPRGAVVTSDVVAGAYEVPLLNVPKFKAKSNEVKIKFGGELSGLEGKAYIDREKGATKIRMHFDDMKKVPANTRFILWASAPDGTYTKLGQVINSGRREETEIKSETALTDFGLFVTAENTDVPQPTSKVYSVFTYTPNP
jgi:hypothetical protein